MIVFLASLAMGVSVSHAAAGDSSSTSLYASPVTDVQGGNLLLPVDGRDLPLTGASGMPASAPQASVVEAIPTPTAFQAGAVLLAGLAIVRGAKKLRFA